MPLGLGFSLLKAGLPGLGASLAGAGAAEGARLAAMPAARTLTLAAEPMAPRFRRWVNDPAYADRVGRYRAAPSGPLANVLFAERFTFSRASKATELDAYGAVGEVAIDGLRQGYALDRTPAGWLIEGGATNVNTNPRGEFAAAPSFPQATLPNGWIASTPGGVTASVVGAGVAANGVPYVDIRYQGTPLDTGARTLTPQGNVAATIGEVWAVSAYIALVGGSLANVAPFTFRVTNETGGTTLTPDANFTRYTNVRTLTAAVAASLLRWNYLDTVTPVDFTLRVGGWQTEKNFVASSLILPPIGTQAATGRAIDLLSITGSNFAAVFGAGAPAGFVIIECTLAALAGATDQTLFQVWDGANVNRYIVRNNSGGASLSAFITPAHSSGGTVGMGTITAGAPFRLGIAWGPNGARFVSPAGVLTSRTGAGPNYSTFTGLQIGSENNGRPISGRILGLWAGSTMPADAKFVAACALGADVNAALAA